MNLPTWKSLPFAIKAAAASAGALFMAGGAVAITAAALGVTHGAAPPATASASPGVSASPAPSMPPAAPAQPGKGQAVRKLLLAAEAQVLGLQQPQLAMDLRQGTTVHQLADRSGLSEAQFESALATLLKPQLDQAVAGGTLTADQEQKALAQLARGVPNWDATPKAAR